MCVSLDSSEPSREEIFEPDLCPAVQHVTGPGSLTPCLCGLGTKVAFPSSLAHTAEQANNMSVLYPESREHVFG